MPSVLRLALAAVAVPGALAAVAAPAASAAEMAPATDYLQSHVADAKHANLADAQHLSAPQVHHDVVDADTMVHEMQLLEH